MHVDPADAVSFLVKGRLRAGLSHHTTTPALSRGQMLLPRAGSSSLSQALTNTGPVDVNHVHCASCLGVKPLCAHDKPQTAAEKHPRPGTPFVVTPASPPPST